MKACLSFQDIHDCVSALKFHFHFTPMKLSSDTLFFIVPKASPLSDCSLNVESFFKGISDEELFGNPLKALDVVLPPLCLSCAAINLSQILLSMTSSPHKKWFPSSVALHIFTAPSIILLSDVFGVIVSNWLLLNFARPSSLVPSFVDVLCDVKYLRWEFCFMLM